MMKSINKAVSILFLISITLVNALIPAFEGLKVDSHAFPVVVMTNAELAYIEGGSSIGVKKFVFAITKSKEDESLIEFTINKNLNDEKSFFMFSVQDIENAKSGGKKCEINENEEYKLSQLQTLCDSLHTEVNTKITKFQEKVNVEYYSDYHISIVSNGKIYSVPLEAANEIINLNMNNPTTYPVSATHLFKIFIKKGIYVKNNKIISFLYETSVDGLSLDGEIETDKIVKWSDKADFTEISIDRDGTGVTVALKIFSLSSNSNIVHYKGIYENSDNIYMLEVGKTMNENDISTEIATQLTNTQKMIKDSYKQRIRMRNLINDEEKSVNKQIKAEVVDSWFYEDVKTTYYKGYFISGNDFTYIEKTKSNDAKVLEKIVYTHKIDWTAQFPSIAISATDAELKVTLKKTVESCSENTPYKASADPKFADVLIELSKSLNSMDIVISGSMKSMKQSTTQRNTQLMSLIGLETKTIPVDKYITHDETYANEHSLYENHHYRILQRVEMDISETEDVIKDYIRFGIRMRERNTIGEYNNVGELYFFSLPNLNDKYLIQRDLSDFYKYDSEFNSYDKDLNTIISDTNSKIDSIVKRITDFVKDSVDPSTETTTTPNSSTNESTETTTESTSSTNDESVSTDNSSAFTDGDIDTSTATTHLEDNSGCYFSFTVISVIVVIISLIM